MAIWIGVDVGGTFTDFVAHDDVSGDSFLHKTPSTPDNPAQAIVTGLMAMIQDRGLVAEAIGQLAHGTTVGTNTLIQRKGGKVSLVVTKGFRDLMEIGRQTRPYHFDMHTDHPPPLVPRRRRFEADERVLADGTTQRPLSDGEIGRVVAEVVATGAEAYAVCLLFSYLAPGHEERLGRALAAAAPDAFVSLSCEVQPEFREYERMSTTVLNACLQPVMARYLSHLGSALASTLPAAEVAINQSSGGLMSLDKARRFPIRTALSGPAAGVLGAIEVARRAGRSDVVTFDMGGTSADVAMVRGLEPSYSFSRVIGGYPVRLPSVDISTVGAGGGSIAWFDRDDLMKVGPISAGAAPGPACYGTGGDKATVTDANLVLGRLSPRGLLDGAMGLYSEASREVLRPIAEKLGFTVEGTALGILEIVTSNMCRAIRAISVEQGYDPRELSLIAFGGAGPLHARAVAASLEMREIIVPPAPGILCAIGLNASDMKEDFVQTVREVVDSAAMAELTAYQGALMDRAREWFSNEDILPDHRHVRISLDMRYVGQNFELSVLLAAASPDEVPEPHSAAELRSMFFQAHERTYGYHNPEDAVEVVNFRLTAVGRKHQPLIPAREFSATVAAAAAEARDIWFDAKAPLATPIFRRPDLAPGQTISGPAVIEQMDTTTLIFPGDTLKVDGTDNLIIEVSQ